MPNPSGPDRGTPSSDDAASDAVESEADTTVEPAADADEEVDRELSAADPETEVIAVRSEQQPPDRQLQPRRTPLHRPGLRRQGDGDHQRHHRTRHRGLRTGPGTVRRPAESGFREPLCRN